MKPLCDKTLYHLLANLEERKVILEKRETDGGYTSITDSRIHEVLLFIAHIQQLLLNQIGK